MSSCPLAYIHAWLKFRTLRIFASQLCIPRIFADILLNKFYAKNISLHKFCAAIVHSAIFGRVLNKTIFFHTRYRHIHKQTWHDGFGDDMREIFHYNKKSIPVLKKMLQINCSNMQKNAMLFFKSFFIILYYFTWNYYYYY